MNIQSTENLINSLPEGYANYLRVCLDPYHDKTIRFEGAPSSRSATSVTLCLNQERSFNADDFGIDSAVHSTWDVHFTMYPFLNKHPMFTGFWDASSANGNEFKLNRTAAFNAYPLMVHGVPSGTPTYSMEDIAVGSINILGLDSSGLTTYQAASAANYSFVRRCLRIVGESFEVVDESPEIYQQGACTVYRYPLDTSLNRSISVGQIPNPSGWVVPTSGYVRQPHELYSLKAPPSNPASAVLVSGSETWKARDGAYVVGTPSVADIPFKTCDSHRILFDGVFPPTEPRWPDYASAGYLFADSSLLNSDFGAYGSSPVTTTTYSPVDACFPFNLSGAYFTNLSSAYGSLRLRYRVYVEILTDPTDSTLVPLASPTLPMNQALNEFIMNIISHQPAGHRQIDNPGGEAWRKILKSIGEVATKSAPALDVIIPGMGGVMSTSGELAKSIAGVIGRKKKAKKVTNVTVSASSTPKRAVKATPKASGKV